MFNPNKSKSIVRRAELKKSRCYEDDIFNVKVPFTTFHTSTVLQAKWSAPTNDFNDFQIQYYKYNSLNDKIQLFDSSIKQGEIIRAMYLKELRRGELKEAGLTEKHVQIYNSLVHTFNRSLKHQNFHEIVSETDTTVTVRILAYGSSPYVVKCGNETFHKICIYKAKNESEEDLYMISLIVEKTMSCESYLVWKEKSKLYVLNKEKAKEAFSNALEYTSKNPCSIIRHTELDVKKVHLIDPEAKLEKISFKLDPLEFYE